MSLALYLDDDYESLFIVRHGSQRGWDVLRSTDAGMRGRSDEEHLAFALSVTRVLVTANVADYYALHGKWAKAGRPHAGLILIKQQQWGRGEVLRRLERLMAARTADDMLNRVEFLSDWGDHRLD